MSSNISCENEAGSSSAAITEKILNSSLYIAAAEGKTDTLKNHKDELSHLSTRNGNSVLHIYIAGPSPTAKIVEEILDMYPGLLMKTNKKDESILHIAARYGHSAIVKVLIARAKSQYEDIESGAGAARLMLQMTNKEKDTALHEAARQTIRNDPPIVVQNVVQNDYLSVVNMLIEEDPDFSYTANNAEETPLYLAAEKGNFQMVFDILVTCKSPTYGGPNGKTALHAAVIGNHPGIILQKENTLTREVDRQGWTPLHYAAYFGCTKIAGDLLQCDDKSAAFYADKNEKQTAIHVAARRGFHETMEKIMDLSLDCCELIDKKSQNILHLAVQSNNEKTVEVILNNKFLSYLLNQRDDEGNTPLHLCAASAFYVPSLIEHPGVDKMAFNQKNLTALDIVETNDKIFLMKGEFISDLKKTGYKRCLRNSINNYVSENESSYREFEQLILDLDKAKEYHLVVAALIATVSFTAGFTLPGGFISSDSPDPGSAILTKNPCFKAFVIFDTISMGCSTSAVFFHFLMVLQKDRTRIFWSFFLAAYLTVIAMFTMILAFITGTYAVFERSASLAVSTSVIGLLFVLSSYSILMKTAKGIWVIICRHCSAISQVKKIFQFFVDSPVVESNHHIIIDFTALYDLIRRKAIGSKLVSVQQS